MKLGRVHLRWLTPETGSRRLTYIMGQATQAVSEAQLVCLRGFDRAELVELGTSLADGGIAVSDDDSQAMVCVAKADVTAPADVPANQAVLWIVPATGHPSPSLFEREAPTDFLRSPVDGLELRLRILALVARTRRTSEVFRSVLRAGPLNLDRLSRTLTVNDVDVPLRRAECAVLEFLLDHSERFVPSKELNRVVLNGAVGGNAARNQVYELRQRLGAAGAPDAIQYLRGRGYRVRWPVAR
ncbi:MAG TPA: winged helix-turn-helix domain-containing protein [Polyangiaceae bacterium]|nr:winged helix-turn-helix domain-containing protein [Polyangiaceae bacterium]